MKTCDGANASDSGEIEPHPGAHALLEAARMVPRAHAKLFEAAREASTPCSGGAGACLQCFSIRRRHCRLTRPRTRASGASVSPCGCFCFLFLRRYRFRAMVTGVAWLQSIKHPSSLLEGRSIDRYHTISVSISCFLVTTSLLWDSAPLSSKAYNMLEIGHIERRASLLTLNRRGELSDSTPLSVCL